MKRQEIIIEGIVQGVGFRPFVYQLARRLELDGWVRNDSRGVTIEVQGDARILSSFIVALREEKPPLSVITTSTVNDLPIDEASSGFEIRSSAEETVNRAQISPDTFVCDDCLNELFDPSDRRFRYPFINCTNCGPRYTIVTGIPYDRPLTTMVDFPMCSSCQAEYDDPASRRFHAQPNACAECGPRLTLRDASGSLVDVEDPVKETVDRLKSGQILAIKGLGGYHLAVDAANDAAVKELRRRKQRDEKPFALMVADIDAVEQIACAGDDETRLLQGVERPILLLRKTSGHDLSEAIAPKNRYFGVMLPYTPLHHLLLTTDFRALVMTSANLSDEPIAFEDDDAQKRLSGIADLFLIHDRRIHIRTDDSIARVMADRPLLLRRSRGFVPRAVQLPVDQPSVLAVGAELKNTICLTRGDRAFLSQHVGDVKNLEVFDAFVASVQHLQHVLAVSPDRIAHDLHPDYQTSRYAQEESRLPTVPVQHHHAHLASCLAEHGRQDAAIGIIFDGIGYGDDGHVWGGEFLVGDLDQYHRAGHFRYQPMPGGDRATREPWRMALSYLTTVFNELPTDCRAFSGRAADEILLVRQALDKKINSPLTSSCGRLFDAVSAILGLHQTVSFEGQAAMALEMIADTEPDDVYPYSLTAEENSLVFDPAPLVRSVYEEERSGVDVTAIAGRFHLSLAAMIEEVASELRKKSGLKTVVLSGGVFQNCLLTELSVDRLERSGFEVLTHSLVPPNDGGVSLGQAVVAARSKL